MRFLLAAAATTAVLTPAAAQSNPTPPAEDRVRLAEASRLAIDLGATVWPGWTGTAMPVLLVSDSLEFLVGHAGPARDFSGRDPRWRPRRFSPSLLATFPAVDGVPTIVIGSAERTGKTSTGWVLTVLHEHFHQWQYTQPWYYPGLTKLDLAGGDTTGQWMLNYPFPYDALPVRGAVRRLAAALVQALEAAPADRTRARGEVRGALVALRETLGPADYRYLEFQLWQEGVARYIEYAMAAAAARAPEPAATFRGLADYAPYRSVATQARRDLLGELAGLELSRDRRVVFYPIGAAIALLLDGTRPDWKRDYVERPFALAALLER